LEYPVVLLYSVLNTLHLRIVQFHIAKCLKLRLFLPHSDIRFHIYRDQQKDAENYERSNHDNDRRQ
jgi:hypothetical protein